MQNENQQNSKHGFIPPSTSLISQIHERVSISEYIRSHGIELKLNAEGNGMAKCPFHDDNSPSMGVSESMGVFNCLGCGAKGNVVGFSELINKISAYDAKMQFAKELGIVSNESICLELKLLQRHSNTYQTTLTTKPVIRKYLLSRGLTDETIKRFGIGVCVGDECDRLSADMQLAALNAGILVASNIMGARNYNRMKDRITFSIKNRDGQVVGFGGRKIDDEKKGPKYVNTGDTEFFKKSDILFGFYEAKSSIHREKFAIVVEGYMDTAILHQEGLSNTVAVMGASASSRAFENLWQTTDRIVFCLDGDEAGRNGTLRSILKAAGTMKDACRIDIVNLPDGVDPDEYVIENGVEAFRDLCKNATPLSQFLCDRALDMDENNNGPLNLTIAESRSRFLKTIEDVALNFDAAPSLQEEINRHAKSAVNAFVIDAALKRQNINASDLEIETALNMMSLQKLTADQLVQREVARNPSISMRA